MYLVVGGWNMLFAYGCFSLLYYFAHDYLPSSVILAIAYLVSSLMGFFTMRHLVFTPVGRPLVEYVRYQTVYLPLMAVNLVVLPLALKYSTLNAYVIQAMFAAFAVVASYLGNKYFTFRRADKEKR